MQRQGWCCPGTELQDLHVGVVLNLLQPSLCIHRYKMRKPLILGSPKCAQATQGWCSRTVLTAPTRLVQGIPQPRYRCFRKESDPPAALLWQEVLSWSQDIHPQPWAQAALGCPQPAPTTQMPSEVPPRSQVQDLPHSSLAGAWHRLAP